MVVTGLYVYPVKSCAGTALTVAQLGPRGIVHDREFMIVDPNGAFLTQREVPRLALIRPARASEGLELCAPGMPPLALRPVADGQNIMVRIWRDHLLAVDQGRVVADWLSTFLHTPCRLVRQADDVVRRVDPTFATHPDDQVGFADGYPLLLLSEESLADLNARLAEPLPMDRFRPNVVIRGAAEPYAEDGWSRVALGAVECSLVKACARCVTTTTDQTTAERGAEPLATLARYRHVPRGVLFGQNLIHHAQHALRIGDTVRVLGRRARSF
jgi:uncharacterized protein YcbX